MRKILPLLFLFLLLTSCGTTVYQLHTECDKNIEKLFKSITTLLMQENMRVVQSDLELGYLQAESMREIFIVYGEQKFWVFQITGNRLTASAKIVTSSSKTSGAVGETYCNDDTDEDWGWYWNVRNGLERLCGNKIVFTEKKVN